MRWAYYPGCCYHTSAREYDQSTRALCQKLGIELIDVPDWSCCGSTAAHGTSHLLALSLAARNLVQAAQTGQDVMTSCAACYQRLAWANYELGQDASLRQQVEDVIENPLPGGLRVLSSLDMMLEYGIDQLAAQVVKPLSGIKAAAYYGCLLVKPHQIGTDDPENPCKMDHLLQAVGATTVDWPFKTECCGASLAVTNEDIVVALTARIIGSAVEAGANCIVTACPLCHFNLDYRQAKIASKLGQNYRMPVFYFTQLLGLAVGLPALAVSTHTHFVDTADLLAAV
ncbi:MAG: CoB--CoM heterodisulfide reductase iron-sulfur subunit B family protein [Bacillota bacterium]|uniref:CoB--CoM heterodisulfide reductase iron-sulfur subunit B family protein n=1 Tax=Desulfurispora thermophila TaxID=265470 RepID=UPI00037B654C|nr:CoB--CoM heterodisulfide reductase iron-sulfur subunit B family protein [Desulfurispora thermophila]